MSLDRLAEKILDYIRREAFKAQALEDSLYIVEYIIEELGVVCEGLRSDVERKE